MVTERGIEANPEKIRAVLDMKSPRSIKEVQVLTGKIASLTRFISRSADKSVQFFKLLRNVKNFEWTCQCEKAFDELKKYLTSPPLLSKPRVTEPLLLYIAVSPVAVSSVLTREEGSEHKPVYYVSKTLQGAEKNYPEIEKLALAVVTTARKLRPYFQSHAIIVLTNHPLRQIISKPDLAGRLVKWAIELSEFDVSYRPRNSIKAQVLADFIVEMEECLSKDVDTCYEAWMLHVDGSSASHAGGAGVWLQGPNRIDFEYAIKLSFPVTNNEAEYEALIAGMGMAQKLKVESLIAYTDSQLVANQFEGVYEVHDVVLGKYLEKVRELAKCFKEFKLHQVPRAENERADALSKFANQALGAKSRKITFLMTEQPVITGFQEVYPIDSQPSWKDDIVKYLSTGALPDDWTEARRLERRAVRYVLEQGDLYKKSFQGPLLKCLDPQEANYVMREIHSGSCGNHS